MLIDTHCHIHSHDYKLDVNSEIAAAQTAGVSAVVLVGEDVTDSKLAVKLAEQGQGSYATVGVHPHEADKVTNIVALEELAKSPKVVGIGECGLDYWYGHSAKQSQMNVLNWQMELAHRLNLPMTLHLRGSKDDMGDAFNDFFKLYDAHAKQGRRLTGVVHSFTAGQAQLEGVLSRGLYVGLNGIATFADPVLREVLNSVPLQSMVLETDAPYLTPVPERGKINAPKYLVYTAEHISKQRGVDIDEIAKITSGNASQLFRLEV